MRQSNVLRTLLAAGLCVGSSQAWSKVTVTKTGNTTKYDVVVDDVTFKKTNLGGKDFNEAKLVGVDGYTGIDYEIGAPEVPVLRFYVTGDVKVNEVSDWSMSVKELKLPLKPNQASWSKSMKVPPPVSYNLDLYKSNKSANKAFYSIEDAGSIRGRSQKLVTVRPFQYKAADGTYSLRRHVTLTVVDSGDRDGAQNVAPTIAFVVGAKFATSAKLDELQASKEAQGYRVKRIVVGQNSVTNDVSIRAALKALLSDATVNLRHAILIGDHTDVPSHTSNTISGITDHFYRAIDTDNYDNDVNGPDIGVGRLSVGTEAQLAVVVDKILRYSQGTFARSNWINHPLFVTTHDRWQVAEGTHNAVIAAHLAPRGYDRVFPDANEKGGDKLYPISLGATPAQIVSHMKDGRTIINFSGHGSHTGWEDVTTADVNSLNDTDAMPYVMSNACITGDFRVEPVFAETWQRHPSGAIMFWGSMDSSYWDEDDFLEKELYAGMFDKNIRAFDLLHQNALAGVWRQYNGGGRSKYYWETYVTFGDPSLEFRPAMPASVDVEGFEAVIMGAASSTMRVVNQSGEGVAGARVTLLRRGDSTSVTSVSDAQGNVTLATEVFSGDAAELSLTVSGASVETLTKSVPVIVPNAPFFGFSSWKVNNREASGVHVGETVELTGIVENYGMMGTNGGSVTIEEITGPARAARTQAAVPVLASRQRGTLGSGLTLIVSPQASRGDTIRVKLMWRSKEGASGTATVSLPVLRAEIELTTVDYGNPAVEGIDGQGDVYVTVKNIGNDTIRNGVLTAANGTCTETVTGKVHIPELAAGASVRIPTPFRVSTSSSCENGSAGNFSFQGTYQGGAMQLPLQRFDAQYLVGKVLSFRAHEEAMSLAIPDNAAGIEKKIEITDSGELKDISIAVNIKHTYVGDLVVALKTPAGNVIQLRNKEGGASDDIVARWGQGGIALEALNALAGTDVKGTWTLTVTDTASSDRGTWVEYDFTARHW